MSNILDRQQSHGFVAIKLFPILYSSATLFLNTHIQMACSSTRSKMMVPRFHSPHLTLICYYNFCRIFEGHLNQLHNKYVQIVFYCSAVTTYGNFIHKKGKVDSQMEEEIDGTELFSRS